MAAHEATAKRRAQKAAAQAPEQALERISEKMLEPETQEAILSPKGVEFQLFGDAVRIYPLAMRRALAFNGLVAKVLGASSELHGENTIMRIGGALAEEYVDDFLTHLARALHPADRVVSQAEIDALVADIEAKMDVRAFRTFSAAFLVMATQNQSIEALGLKPAEAQAKN